MHVYSIVKTVEYLHIHVYANHVTYEKMYIVSVHDSWGLTQYKDGILPVKEFIYWEDDIFILNPGHWGCDITRMHVEQLYAKYDRGRSVAWNLKLELLLYIEVCVSQK